MRTHRYNGCVCPLGLLVACKRASNSASAAALSICVIGGFLAECVNSLCSRHTLPAPDIYLPHLYACFVCLLQVEATYFGTPRVEAFQLEGSLNGVDMLPLMQTAPTAAGAPAAATGAMPGPGVSVSSSSGSLFGPEAPPALVDGSRVRLKVTGGLRLSAVRDEGAAARRQAGLTGEGGYLFTGEDTTMRLVQVAQETSMQSPALLPILSGASGVLRLGGFHAQH